MGLKSIVLVVILALSSTCIANAEPTIFDITKYGATRDADISAALVKAWNEASNLTTPSRIVIPKGNWSLSQVYLAGNKAPLELQVQGIVQAPLGELPNKEGPWIVINYVNFFELSGGGVFDGRGQQAWKRNDCHKNSKCPRLPLNLSFNFINNSIIHDVTTKDSKNFHVNCISSRNVTFQRFTITAPGDSPNTDGIHIARSSNVSVIDSNIGTGDDCISIGDETTELHIQNVTCGPGHGISVGSLGRSTTEKDVVGIYVRNCTFNNTDNGVRVKTWPSAPATLKIRELHFEDIIVNNVRNPIVIDQEYCPWNLCNLKDPSKISISKININNVRGTSASPEAVTFKCSGSNPCEDVNVGNIDIKYTGNLGPATTVCHHVKPVFSGTQNPPVCATSQQSA